MAKEKKVTKRVEKPKGGGKRLTEAEVAKIKELRKQDPEKYTYVVLAAKFGCTDGTAFRAVNAEKKPKKAKAPKAAKPKAAKKATPRKRKPAAVAAAEPTAPETPAGE